MARLPATLPSLDAAASVLVVKPSSLGDIVHTLPAVAWLKQEWPDLRIHWLANNEWTPLVEGSALLESVIAFPRQEFRGLGGLFRARRWMHTFSRTMGQHHILLALDFQGLLRSAWLARRCGATHVLGLSDAREGARFFYTASVPVDGIHHAVDRYLAMVRYLGPRTGPTAALDGDWLPAGKPIDRFDLENFILLHPFSRGEGKSLDWSAVAALAAAWHPRALVVAGQTTFPPPQPLPAHVTNLVNQTSLDQLIWLMRRARFVVSVDSGPMHLASALHRPLLGLHTWSDPRKVGPYDSAAWVWKAGRILHRPEVDQSLASRTEPLDGSALQQVATFVGNHAL
jgi:ADP-heptose:LPS heptosyltransferase